MAQDKGFEQAVIDRVNAQLEPMAEAAAQAMGMPPGGQKYSEKDQLALWCFSPISSPEERVSTMLQLKALGQTDEQITDAIYPERRKIIQAHHPSISKQIAYARQMDNLMEKQGQAFAAEIKQQGSPLMQPAAPLPEPAPAPTPQPMMPTPEPVAPTAPAPSVLDTPLSMIGG